MPTLQPQSSNSEAPLSSGNKEDDTPNRREKLIVFWIAFLVLLSTCIPYWYGFFIQSPGKHFAGYPFNIDDHYVYLSWIKQASQGHFFIRDLFTTETQPAKLFSFLFLSVGTVARVLHISPWLSNEIFRLVFGAVLLTLIYNFYRLCIPQNRIARITAFAFACFGSGFGWVYWQEWKVLDPRVVIIDTYQPEAYTFTSLYLYALFTVATCLILGTLYAMLRCAHTGETRYAVIAGTCAFLLGNIHSYDIFHVCAAWGLFMVVFTIVRRGQGVGKLWMQSMLALAMSLPTVLYTFYVYKHNPAFNIRADTTTLSPPLWDYVYGYGIEFIFALYGIILIAMWFVNSKPSFNTGIETAEKPPVPGDKLWRDATTALFVVCWCVAGLAVIYVPIAFQRKTLMGEHLPMCLLAGWSVAMMLRNSKQAKRMAVAAVLVLASAPSNVLFLARDMMYLRSCAYSPNERAYLSQDQWDAFQYISKNTPPDAAILSRNFIGLYIPGITGHAVRSGHWAETPNRQQRIEEFGHFSLKTPTSSTDADRRAIDNWRRTFLAGTTCKYLLYPADAGSLFYIDKQGRRIDDEDFAASAPPYLVPIYRNKEYVLFKIDLSR